MRLAPLLRAKAWECFVGWLGLALALVTQFMLVQGVKNAVGYPRPDMLSRCRPDLGRVSDFAVGGYGQDISPRWVLVTRGICTQTNVKVLDGGFKSFPSGHASTSFAGLVYLSLYLCSKFAVVFPYLPTESLVGGPLGTTVTPRGATALRRSPSYREIGMGREDDAFVRHRDEAAAPPAYLLYFIYVPVGGAVYISVSRYFDYRHHAFDLFAGAAVGIACAWLGFRWYHLPVSRGSGWSWGPRSPNRAFAAGVGTHGFVDESSLRLKLSKMNDLEGGGGGRVVGEGSEDVELQDRASQRPSSGSALNETFRLESSSQES